MRLGESTQLDKPMVQSSDAVHMSCVLQAGAVTGRLGGIHHWIGATTFAARLPVTDSTGGDRQ